jgi:hypothetical protein
MKQSRFPGAKSFETNQQHIFYGRDEDTTKLYQLIKLTPLVVLYAKSGMGKSSLLNAGIIPNVLKDGSYQPVCIRFKPYTKGSEINTPPVLTTRQSIAKSETNKTFLDSLISDVPSLWHDLKVLQINGHKKVLLIFDQFEELFTYPSEDIKKFTGSLAEVLYTKIPQRYRDVLEKQIEEKTYNLTSKEYKLLQEPIDLRVVIAIRSDSMSLLHELTNPLQTILKNLFELPPLSIIAVERAITAPARYQNSEFSSPHFDFEPQAIKKIIDFLTENKTQIESTQVQIIGQSIENKIVEAGQIVKANELGDLNQIIENYYYDQLELLKDKEVILSCRKLIEEGLIFEDEERKLPPLYDGQIIKEYGISKETLKQLVEVNLLHCEPSEQGGGYTYELTHDTLIKPILKAKNKRIEEKREQELEDAKILAEKKSEKLTRSYQYLGFSIFALLLASWSFWGAQKARDAAEIAELRVKSVINNIYFYQNRFGLAYNDTTNTYGFIDKDLNQKIEFKYKEALPFDYTGYAKVKSKDNIYFLIDTLGIEYRLANDIDQLNSKVSALDLRNKILTSIPKVVFENKQLKILLLNQNRLTGIDGIEGLRKLEYLDLHGNLISKVSLKIGSLLKLNTLDLSNNELSKIPTEVGRLNDLETLDLSNNKLTNVPIELGNLSNLKYFYLQNNGLTNIPDDFKKLLNIKTFRLNNNQIDSLPSSFCELIQLKEFDFSKNKLDEQKIPPCLNKFIKH